MYLVAMITGLENTSGTGSIDADRTAELTSKPKPTPLYALKQEQKTWIQRLQNFKLQPEVDRWRITVDSKTKWSKCGGNKTLINFPLD